MTGPGPAQAAAGQAPDHPGTPDAFERLWTPHRMVYVGGTERQESPAGESTCPFCRAPGREDADGLIVRRGEHAYVVLNLYPYNPGHLLICPLRHVADYTELTDAERDEIAALTQQALLAIRAVSAPQGFNLGVNLGEVAGGSVSAHFHQHVVPRWGGDANFLPIVARTKALPQVLGETRRLLAEAWLAIEREG